MFSITLKMAVDAPIPSASVKIATTANPGVFLMFLSAYRTSCPSVSIVPLTPLLCDDVDRRALAGPAFALSTHSFVIKFDATAPKKLPNGAKTGFLAEGGGPYLFVEQDVSPTRHVFFRIGWFSQISYRILSP